MFMEDGLYKGSRFRIKTGSENQKLTLRHFPRVSGTGLILNTWQSLCQLAMSFSSDPYRSSNSSFMAELKDSRASCLFGSPPFQRYVSHKRLNSTEGEIEGWYWNLGYCKKKPSSGVVTPRGRTMIFFWLVSSLLVRSCA